ncbi:maltose ABC transporter permease MalF [Aquincola tertiaricarbonis]|uniref:maltose ABC transporter permease MalF n=1 Tax=Aquincola tertiaricarbonis TaxID=391953 RepID=UPI000615175F|nr:maltose ABC transporter permease MalF [Aquincola tertiaricarbonis]
MPLNPNTAAVALPGLPDARSRRLRWLGPALGLLLALGALYILTAVYLAGETLLAGALLATLALAGWVYGSQRLYAWRYLFPGVAAVVIFVVFPILYTVSMSFSNASSRHLLTFERATRYFLDETYAGEGRSLQSSLRAEGGGYRLRLQDEEAGTAYETGPLPLDRDTPAKAKAVPASGEPAGEALPLKDVIRLQPALKALTVQMPDDSELRSTGLRSFGPVAHLYRQDAQGRLVNQQDGSLLTPNMRSGFYEAADGSAVQPGFQVGIGWAHYARIFTDEAFREPFLRIFGWTVTFAALTVLFAASLGMLLAVLLTWEALRFRAVYQTLLFLPYAVPGFISILVFKGLFNNNFGEINLILDALFGIKPAWFSDPLLAKSMLLIVNTWLGYPYMMVICMGLIKAIPADLYEASAVAGAGPLTNFFRITLPLVLKPLTPLLIAAFAFNFNNFVLISLLTNGRPDFLDTRIPAGTTDILVSYTYRMAFEDSGQNFGLAAAISTVIFAMVALLSWINLRAARVTKEAS